MINVNDLKPGITFEYNNNIYIVIESQHSKSGRGQAHVKAKIKNLRTKSTILKTFIGGEKVKKAYIEQFEIQYLYNDGNRAFFMNTITYEQFDILIDLNIKNNLMFLIDGSFVKIAKFNNEILDVILPQNVVLTVATVEEAVKSDSASGSNKKVVLETGLEIFVPLFIKQGEKIIISTSDKKYIGRA